MASSRARTPSFEPAGRSRAGQGWPTRDPEHSGPLLIYLMDPQCGWCFGHHHAIAPFSKLHGNAGPDAALRVVAGGLFIPRRAWSASKGDEKRPIAKRVEATYGVRFSEDYFRNVLGGPWLDSTPPCRGIIASEVMGANPLTFAGSLMDGAFRLGRNISETDVVIDLATEFGLERREFATTLASEIVESRLRAALGFSRRVATGFPSVFLQSAPNTPLRRLGGGELTTDDIRAAVSSAASG